MSIQNDINAMLGTVAAAATMGKHIKNQNQEIANQEAQKKLQIKDLEYANEKDNIELAKKKADVASEMVANPLKNQEGEIITNALEYKKQQLDNVINTATKYKSGKRKEAAIKARDALQDEMFTVADLKFNIEKRTEQINILKGGKK